MHAPVSRHATAAPPLAWSRAFPATPEQVREARRFLAGILGGSPAADDAILCLSDLATCERMLLVWIS